MIFLRAIIFTLTLAFGFILSGNLAGIEKIREGATDLTTSIINSFHNREFTSDTNIANDTSIVSRYATVKTAKYLTLALGIFCGMFTATLIGSGVIGLTGGVLFSPEIASVPVLAEAAMSISSTASALWTDLIAKITNGW